MTHIPTVLRWLLGATFVLFSVNYFVPFMPHRPLPPEAMAYAGALVGARLLLVVKIAELAAGVLLLANRFVPLALALLAPIIVGILHFHTVLAPSGLPMALGVAAMEIALGWLYRDAFAPMLAARVRPAALASRREREKVVASLQSPGAGAR